MKQNQFREVLWMGALVVNSSLDNMVDMINQKHGTVDDDMILQVVDTSRIMSLSV